MKGRKQKALEDIFLDEIIWRVESIQKHDIKGAYDYSGLKTKAQNYKRLVDITCEIILDYIEQAQHLVKQEDNYKQIMLDTLLAADAITQEVFDKYSPLPN